MLAPCTFERGRISPIIISKTTAFAILCIIDATQILKRVYPLLQHTFKKAPDGCVRRALLSEPEVKQVLSLS